MSGGFWSLLTILGPLLLGGVIAWALIKNRRAPARDIDRTEAATRQNYADQDAQDKRDDSAT